MPLSPTELRDLASAELADLIDLQFSRLGLAAIRALAPQVGNTVLDIGCGAGQTLEQLAAKVGEAGRIVGIDVAPHVLDVARARTARLGQVALVQADAATVDLPDHFADGVFSRFGVMGFANPVAAFANLRRMSRPGGRLAFVCWRSLEENELDWMPLQAAQIASATTDAVPFSLADADGLRRTLEAAGYTDITVRDLDMPVSCGDVEATTRVLTRVGALGSMLRKSPELIADATSRVRQALYAHGDGDVRLTAATWLVDAVA